MDDLTRCSDCCCGTVGGLIRSTGLEHTLLLTFGCSLGLKWFSVNTLQCMMPWEEVTLLKHKPQKFEALKCLISHTRSNVFLTLLQCGASQTVSTLKEKELWVDLPVCLVSCYVWVIGVQGRGLAISQLWFLIFNLYNWQAMILLNKSMVRSLALKWQSVEAPVALPFMMVYALSPELHLITFIRATHINQCS